MAAVRTGTRASSAPSTGFGGGIAVLASALSRASQLVLPLPIRAAQHVLSRLARFGPFVCLVIITSLSRALSVRVSLEQAAVVLVDDHAGPAGVAVGVQAGADHLLTGVLPRPRIPFDPAAELVIAPPITRKRLVNLRTRRFRGNVMDVTAGGIAIQANWRYWTCVIARIRAWTFVSAVLPGAHGTGRGLLFGQRPDGQHLPLVRDLAQFGAGQVRSLRGRHETQPSTCADQIDVRAVLACSQHEQGGRQED